MKRIGFFCGQEVYGLAKVGKIAYIFFIESVYSLKWHCIVTTPCNCITLYMHMMGSGMYGVLWSPSILLLSQCRSLLFAPCTFPRYVANVTDTCNCCPFHFWTMCALSCNHWSVEAYVFEVDRIIPSTGSFTVMHNISKQVMLSEPQAWKSSDVWFSLLSGPAPVIKGITQNYGISDVLHQTAYR